MFVTLDTSQSPMGALKAAAQRVPCMLVTAVTSQAPMGALKAAAP